MEIRMGKGEWLFSSAVHSDGTPGLLIRKADKDYAVGDLDPEKSGDVHLKDEDVFISIPDLKSAVILQEQIIKACIEVLGWKVEKQ